MALNVKNEEADRLARELADLTGESITQAIVVALQERLQRARSEGRRGTRLRRLAGDVAAIPVLDGRPADAILGYDELGLPG